MQRTQRHRRDGADHCGSTGAVVELRKVPPHFTVHASVGERRADSTRARTPWDAEAATGATAPHGGASSGRCQPLLRPARITATEQRKESS